MELSSARGLKTELRASFGPSDVRSASWPRIAIGLAPAKRPGDYHVAVRTAAELPPQILAQITSAASGEIDLRVTGEIEAKAPLAGVPRSPLAIGASIAHYRCSAGTVGFFARRRSDGAIGIVSNNHVLAAEDQGREGDEILHPGPADRGRRPKDVVAQLAGGYPRIREHGHRVDCAFARLARGVSYDPLTLRNGQKLQISGAPETAQRDVAKIGRTTGLTFGRITAFELDDVDVHYSFGPVLTNSQIEIESVDTTPFSRGGDSGSLVFSRGDASPVGLLYACSAIGGSNGSGLSYANPIASVLEVLDVWFVS